MTTTTLSAFLEKNKNNHKWVARDEYLRAVDLANKADHPGHSLADLMPHVHSSGWGGSSDNPVYVFSVLSPFAPEHECGLLYVWPRTGQTKYKDHL